MMVPCARRTNHRHFYKTLLCPNELMPTSSRGHVACSSARATNPRLRKIGSNGSANT
jgi:hypothetical protein